MNSEPAVVKAYTSASQVYDSGAGLTIQTVSKIGKRIRIGFKSIENITAKPKINPGIIATKNTDLEVLSGCFFLILLSFSSTADLTYDFTVQGLHNQPIAEFCAKVLLEKRIVVTL